MPQEASETQNLWNSLASDWFIQVGKEGDRNRIFNSDPVLWDLLGPVKGLTVLDAGCGTGYLSGKLHEAGAIVTGLDFSRKMIGIAQENFEGPAFVCDYCETLTTQPDSHFDVVVSNYVLMDVQNLEPCIAAFHRVLKPNGVAVLVFSHPCFPAGYSSQEDKEVLRYDWPHNYFDSHKIVEPPWAHFKNDFIWFHRPISEYFRVFRESGFTVTDLRERRLSPELACLVTDAVLKDRLARVPFSIALKLERKQK